MIDILESKPDSTVLDPEIYIENYKTLFFDGNWNGRGVACYIRSGISYKLNSFLSNEIENITLAITIAIIYGLSN